MQTHKLTDTQLKQIRGYKGVIRIVGRLTVEKASYPKFDGIGYSLRAWHGRSTKATHYYTYRSEEKRNTAIEQLIASERLAMQRRSETEQKQNEARKNFVNPFVVGTVFENSWGYDQTNIDYYEVTAATGKKLTLRPVAQAKSETGWLQGDCQPIRGHYIGEKLITKVVQFYDNGTPYVATEFGCMSVWDGKKSHWTAYH